MIKLNEQQQAIIDSDASAICVIAGPGSGKTRVLSEKVISLLEKDVHSGNILAITFTNKAANEMKERIIKGTTKSTEYLTVCTFHALGMKMLRENYDKIGYNNNIVIIDEVDSKRIIDKIIKANGFSVNTDVAIKEIGNQKSLLVNADDFYEKEKDNYELQDIALIYQNYEEKLKSINGFDFNDLITKTVYMLQTNPEVAQKYQERFTHVFVDEFQDTNIAQYEMVKLIAKHNILVVGDQDQSIYGWRGACQEVTNMFINDYHAQIFKLEQNYRSYNSILKAANSLISNNKDRIDKNMWSNREGGEKLIHRVLPTEKHEAEFIARTIIEKVEKENMKYSNFTVLYRNNEFSRVLEEYLVNYKVPYHIHGGVKFFQRKEIKDVVAYLKVIFNPQDDTSLTRIINTPKRSLGDTTINKLSDIAKQNGISIWEVIENVESYDFSKATQVKLKKFQKLILDLQKFSKVANLTDLYAKMLKKTEYLKMLEKDTTEYGKQRVDNIEELASLIFECDERKESLELFLTETALTDNDSGIDGRDKVKLMTIHASKGLEFNTVFIVGLEEDLFPSRKAILQDEIEEERRLMYVAITRAEDAVFVTNVKSRLFHGVKKANPISRFINDIEDHYLDREYGKHERKKDRYNYEKNSDIVEGDIIVHDDFGRGKVLEATGEGDSKVIAIEFDSGDRKTLLAFHPKISKAE